MAAVSTNLADWAVRKVEAEYKDDVCILVEHKTLRLEQDRGGAAFSFFIPATTRANGLARTFIVGGIGHDLFPMSWQRIERMAELKDSNTTCLGDSTILYARTESDQQRFLSLQARLEANLRNPHQTHEAALEWVISAEEIHRNQVFEERPYKIREHAGFICNALFTAVALMNGKYYSYGWTDQMEVLRSLRLVPLGFAPLYRAVICETSVDKQKRLCHEIISSMRAFLAANDPDAKRWVSKPDFTELASWYQELSYTWRRVYHWCDAKDAINAYLWGCFLQNEVDSVGTEYGLTDIDLMGSFNPDDLAAFRERAERVEGGFISAIEAHGVTIDSYEDVNDFLRRNP